MTYGDKRRLFARLFAELILWAVEQGYVVAKNLPPAWRKGFFIAVDVLLLYCIQHNLQAGAGFNIAF